ncbi:MAG TPA: helix-turn-helix transcriptional regulator [Bacteroidales bacterium]|nr:helix-turn-helix transcriptional regulator [Bacteroidales bacterium]
MDQPDLGKKVLELRLSKGLTQSELADKCKIGLRTIQRIESAEVKPRSYTIKLIFSCLDYDIHNWINSKDYKLQRSSYNLKIWLGQFYKYVFDLFNLKTNTMKKVSILSLMLIFVCAGLFLANRNTNAQTIDGWFKAGNKPNSYSVGLDKSIYKSGGSSAFIESIEKRINGFGTLMQTCSAKDYLGKRIKITAYIKSEKVSDWAGMWMRVDSKTREPLSFDNMQDRAIKGSKDWTKCEIVLDVPEESGTLNFGILISGTGKVWFDDISFEVVDKLKVKSTSMKVDERKVQDKPSNIDFEK